MDKYEALVWLGLILLSSRKVHCLLKSDSQDSFNFPVPSTAGKPPILDSPPIDGIFRILQSGGFDNNAAEEESSLRPVQNNIRRSFSLLTTTKPRTTPHYEALTNNSNNNEGNPRLKTYFINNEKVEIENSQELVDKFRELKKGQSKFIGRTTRRPQYEEKSYESKLEQDSSRYNINLQPLPIRHWSTESNVIREDEFRGTAYPQSFTTPIPSSLRPYNPSRGNIRYTIHTTERPTSLSYGQGFEPTRSGKNIPTRLFKPNIDYRNAYVAPTTYRPPFIRNDQGSYSFSLRSQNHTREESGDTRGNFRGSVRYIDTLGRDRQTDYKSNPEDGFITSEIPYVSIGGRTGQKYFPPISTPRTYTPNDLAYSYSYRTDLPVSSTTVAYDGFRDGRTGGFSSTRAPLYIYSPSIATALPPPDGSYVFSYNAGDHQREEVRDKNGNVRGMYSFEGPDGDKKIVHYIANADTGFVAQGPHLPIQHGSPPVGLPQSQYPAVLQSPSGAYSFSYNAGDHVRHEARDEAGNVQGSFGLITY